MGQNQSLPDGSEVIFIDESLQMFASRKCGIVTEAGHSRPLPPPRSREGVLSELREFCSSDVTSPLNEIAKINGRKRSIGALEDGHTPNSVQDDSENSAPSEKDIQRLEARSQFGTIPPHIQPPKRKKRLFANEQAVKAAQEISEQSIKRENESFSFGLIDLEDHEVVPTTTIIQAESSNTPDRKVDEAKTNNASRKRGPFVDDDSTDEGYYTYSPSSPGTSFHESDEDELVESLAKLHRCSDAIKPKRSDAQVPTPPDSPTIRKLQEEDKSAEQSRRLREQKLSGQALNSKKHEDFTASDSFLDEDLILSDDGSIDTEARISHNDSKDSKEHNLASRRGRSGVSAPRSSSNVKRYSTRVDSPYSEDSELDHHLDIAQSFTTRTPWSKPRLRKINSRTPSYCRFPTRSNPYSRHAAERYRTQGRHLNTLAPAQQANDSTPKGSNLGEDRLRALVNKPTTSSSLPLPLSSFNRSPSPAQRPSRKFHAIDLASRPLKPITHHRVPYVDDAKLENSTRDSPLESETLSSTEIHDSEEAPARPLSLLEMMACKAEQRGQSASSRPLRNSGPTLDLGIVADIDHEDEDEVRDEHERLKEQQKDLASIECTGLAIAHICALGPLTALEAKEEHEFQKFASVVLDAKRSGKSRRARMTTIRGNFDRRLEKEYHIATDDRVQEEYNSLLGAKRVALMNDLRDPLDDLVHNLGTKRKTLTMKRHNPKGCKKGSNSKKQVRFADTVIDLDEPQQKQRTRPLGKEAKQIVLLEEKLKLARAQQSNVDRIGITDLPSQAQECESEVSEEDSGAECVSSTARDDSSANLGFTASTSFPVQRSREQLDVDQDLEEINRLENERQQQGGDLVDEHSYKPDKPRPSYRGGQRPDSVLIQRMMANKYGASRTATRNTHTHPFDDVAEISDFEVSVVSAFSSCSSISSDQQHIVSTFKYTVVGRFVGIEIYNQEQEYVLKTFHNLGRANTYVQQIMTSLATNYPAVTGNDFELVTRCRKGIYQQVLALGEQELIQASVWIERRVVEIDTGKVESRKARKAILVEARGTWVVDWEKTVSTTVTVEVAASTSGASATGLTDKDDEDFFGHSPSPTAPAPTTTEQAVITRPTPDEILSNMFTTAALANRRAKELYISWYSQFFPEKQRPYYGHLRPASGSRYDGMLGQIDMALEEELERLGEWNMGCWEEEVESDGGAEKEKMRVWVRRVGVLGPQN